MPKLSDFLNKDETKTRIGFTDIQGYLKALDAMTPFEKTKEETKADNNKKSQGGDESTFEDMSVSTIVKDGATLVDDNTLKQIKLNILCGYPFPLYDDSNKAYHMATPQNANINGNLNGEATGFPASFQTSIVAAIKNKTKNIKAGVGLNLDGWGAAYLQQFFGDGTIGVVELKKLAKENKLCAEIVIHSSKTLGSSGQVVYANVVDCEVGDKNSCLISPMFCFGSFKKLGLDFGFSGGAETSTLQSTTKLKPAKEPTYDYKTGEITNISSSDLETFAKEGKENLTISPESGKCCRVRLFVENLQEAQSSVGDKKISPQMAEKNRKKTYTGGQAEVITGNATYNTMEKLDVAIDIGHSSTPGDAKSDRPEIYKFKVWSTEKGRELAKLVGFSGDSEDFLEHALNKKVADVLAATLTAKGFKTACFDYPKMLGRPEARRIVNELTQHSKPKVLLSIHQNAAGGNTPETFQMSKTAWGTCYDVNTKQGNYNQARILGHSIVNSIRNLRTQTGAKNRADEEANTVANILDYKLSNDPYACAVIIECAFYDNLEDELWLFRNLREFTNIIAEKTIEYITKYYPS